MTPPQAIAAKTSMNLDMDFNYSAERLFFYCTQLSSSVEHLRDSIDRYETYKNRKKPIMESDDARE